MERERLKYSYPKTLEDLALISTSSYDLVMKIKKIKEDRNAILDGYLGIQVGDFCLGYGDLMYRIVSESKRGVKMNDIVKELVDHYSIR